MRDVSGTLPQRFKAAFPMARFRKATWSKHSNSYKHATDTEMDRFSNGLWKKFVVEFRTRIAA
jgi:hypothetical protein